METIVKDQLIDYIEENKLLSKWQSGYRKNHSCETALNLVLNKWKKLVDNKQTVLSVFLDLKRAFETIDRSRLVEKLKTFGIQNNALKWFTSYLDGRKQCTKINNFTSEQIDNDLGVPQGSVLGAILFIIYINDLPNILENVSINLFADDTLLYIM